MATTIEHDFGWGPKAMPRLSEADMRRLTGMVKRGELHPVLNHTKWAELRTEMLAAPAEQRPQFRARSVFAPPDFCTDWDGEFYYHAQPVADLEWMELRATSSDWLRDELRRHSIRYSLEAGAVRVWGYTRPGPQPEWL
ncbi:MAG: hypothetical protein EOO29_02715 [Comamonadaceae bacterium]|nr:MAG: hypothetical protein EOO29_02715 [Comamonadaceae bacterium]